MKKWFLLSSLLWIVLNTTFAQTNPAKPPEKPSKSDPGAAIGRVTPEGPRAAAGRPPEIPTAGKLGETAGGKPAGLLPGGIPSDNPKSSAALEEAAKAAKEILDRIAKAVSNLDVTQTTGTGQTIGIIANITVTNNNDFPVEIQPQIFYIPSDGQHQNYVGSIPKGITIPPNNTVDIPVNGICADVHTPPVQSGEGMPPISTWVPVGGSSTPPSIGSEPPGTSGPTDPPGAGDPSGAGDPPGAGDPSSTVPKPVDPPGVGNPPSTHPKPVDPPGESTTPGVVTNPVDPPGISGTPSTDPKPGDPPGGSTTPEVVMLIPVVNTVPVPDFNPSDIPHIITTSGYKPVDTTDPDIIITWPDTDIPVGGTIDPVTNPEVFGKVIVGVLQAIEDAVVVVQQSGTFPTPFSGNSEKERESIVQQTFWMVNAVITGQDYTKEDFTKNAYDQFQNTTGNAVTSLNPEQKEEVDAGLTDFWNTFQVTGVVAKVISAESPGIEIDSADLAVLARYDPLDEWRGYDEVDKDAATDQAGGQDDVADPKVVEEEESAFKCVCPDTISYTLEIKRGGTAVLESPITTGSEIDVLGNKGGSDIEMEVKVEKLKFGDTLDINISNVEINCQCTMTNCDVSWVLYIEQSNNCETIGRDISKSIKIKTKAKNSKDTSIFISFWILATCTAEGCTKCTCVWDVKLKFIDSKSK